MSAKKPRGPRVLIVSSDAVLSELLALEAPFGIRLIDTVRAKGYRLRIALREYRCEND